MRTIVDYFALAKWYGQDTPLPPYDAELFELAHGRDTREYSGGDAASARL